MSYTLVLEWMPGDLYMSAVTARCTAPTSSYSVVWLPPNKVYQITLYCGSTSLVSFLVGAFRGKAWSYMRKRERTSVGDTVVLVLCYVFIFLIALITFLPFWELLVTSLSSRADAVKFGVKLFTFHPELTGDVRVHELFLRMVRGEG